MHYIFVVEGKFLLVLKIRRYGTTDFGDNKLFSNFKSYDISTIKKDIMQIVMSLMPRKGIP